MTTALTTVKVDTDDLEELMRAFARPWESKSSFVLPWLHDQSLATRKVAVVLETC
jgi:hypothetical protein